MSPKKKSKSEDTVQATLGELIEEKPTKAKKKKRTKSNSKTVTRKKKAAPTELPLSSLPGVGKKVEERLKKAGYKSVLKLSKARYTTVAKKVKGISKDGAKDLIKAAKEQMKEKGKAKKPSKKKEKRKKSKKEKSPSQDTSYAESPLSILPGVGGKIEERLVEASYDSILKISKSKYTSIAKKVKGISKDGAKDLIKAAKEQIKKKGKAKKPSKKKEKRKKSRKKKAAPTELPLSSLPGVGKKVEERLKKAGYKSVLKLSKARYTSVAKKVKGISKDGAKDLVEAAKEQIKKVEKQETQKSIEYAKKPQITLSDIPGVGSKLAKRLKSAGYDSVARLSRAKPDSIAKRVSHLSSDRADTLIHSAKEMMQSKQLESIKGAYETKPAPPTKAQPESKKETKKSVTPKKKPKARKSKAPKKKEKAPKKKVKKRKKTTTPKKKRSKIKRKKSGLPVPQSVQKLTKEMMKKRRKAERDSRKPKEEEESDQEKTIEVVELTSEETSEKLVDVALEILHETMTTGRPAFEIPSRSSSNIVWDELRDLLLLGMRTISRPYHSLGSVVDATRTARVMEIVYQLLKSNLHATKREIYYSDVNLFRKQRRSDKIIEDVAAMLQTTRDSIHVVASARGSAMGRVVVRDAGDRIDLTKMGTGGWAITPFLDQVEIIESDAEYILLSEKDAAVMRLAEVKYWNRQPCIVLTGKGSGDIATRAFLRRLVKELEIPAFALVDSDPYGHYIYSVFLRGSKRLSYESPFIATPELKLLGVLSRDLDEYNIPKSVRIPMESSDIKRVKDMLKEPFVKNNKPWVRDLKLMLRLKEKAEIQAFASHSFEYLTDDYLPTKLETGDWI